MALYSLCLPCHFFLPHSSINERDQTTSCCYRRVKILNLLTSNSSKQINTSIMRCSTLLKLHSGEQRVYTCRSSWIIVHAPVIYQSSQWALLFIESIWVNECVSAAGYHVTQCIMPTLVLRFFCSPFLRRTFRGVHLEVTVFFVFFLLQIVLLFFFFFFAIVKGTQTGTDMHKHTQCPRL